MIFSCNIHNLVKIQIHNVSRHWVKDMNLRYHYFEDNADSNPDICVRIGPFQPDLSRCFCLDRKYYIRQNYLYIRDSDKKLNWEAEISGLEESSLNIRFHHGSGNFYRFPWFLFPDLILDFYVLQPLIAWKLAQQGALLNHAAAVCKDNKALIIAGRGGSRKTQAVINLLKQGYQYLSDDLVILKDRTAYCLPLSPELFFFSNNIIQREDISLFNQVRLLAYLRRKNKPRIDVVHSAPAGAFVVLYPRRHTDLQIRPLSPQNLVNCLAANQRMEETSYVSYKYMIGSFLDAYQYVFPNVHIREQSNALWTDLQNKLAQNPVPSYAMEFSDIHTVSSHLCQLL